MVPSICGWRGDAFWFAFVELDLDENLLVVVSRCLVKPCHVGFYHRLFSREFDVIPLYHLLIANA